MDDLESVKSGGEPGESRPADSGSRERAAAAIGRVKERRCRSGFAAGWWESVLVRGKMSESGDIIIAVVRIGFSGRGFSAFWKEH